MLPLKIGRRASLSLQSVCNGIQITILAVANKIDEPFNSASPELLSANTQMTGL